MLKKVKKSSLSYNSHTIVIQQSYNSHTIVIQWSNNSHSIVIIVSRTKTTYTTLTGDNIASLLGKSNNRTIQQFNNLLNLSSQSHQSCFLNLINLVFSILSISFNHTQSYLSTSTSTSTSTLNPYLTTVTLPDFSCITPLKSLNLTSHV